MAEGSSFQSFTDGSDACAENCCTPCGEDDINEEAVKYCPECDEYLCTRCMRQHTRQKATKTHKLVDKKDAKHSIAVVKTKCLYHPDRDIEMFCRTHDMVYCTMCIATDHRACEHVDKIESKLTSNVNQTEINRLSDELTTAKETLINATEKQKHNLASLEEERINIDKTLDDIEEKMIRHIRKLRQEAKQSVTKKYDMMKLELESEISTSSSMIKSLKESLQLLKSIDSLNTEQQFIHLKLTKKTITNARELNAQSDSKGICSINFTANVALADFVSSVDSFGQVQEVKQFTKPKLYKVKTSKYINVRNSDKNSCRNSDICQLPDGRIILTDHANRKVKMLGIKYNVVDSCALDAGPTGICCISSNEVAIKMSNNTVQFVSVESSLSKTRCISIFGGGFYGMTYCDGELWVSTGDGINIYNTAGTLIKIVDKNHNGNRIFKSTTQHLSCTDDTVIVTDWSDGVVCLNKDGTVMRELRDSRLKNSVGVYVADDGTVFVCGYNSNNIVMFSKDGNCQGELVATNCGLTNPINIFYDKHKNTLIITSNLSNTLKVIEFEE